MRGRGVRRPLDATHTHQLWLLRFPLPNPLTDSQLPALSYLELQDRGQGKEKRKREMSGVFFLRANKVLKKCKRECAHGGLPRHGLSSSSLRLVCCWSDEEGSAGPLSDNCFLLIYNVKLNVSLRPASARPLQADRAVTQAGRAALTGWQECQNWCRMLHLHDLKYKSLPACTQSHKHIRTSAHFVLARICR